MTTSEKTYLQNETCRVTSGEVVLEGHRYAMNDVVEAKLVSDSGYQGKTVPFVLALGFVVWTLSELVNGTDDYTYAFIAGVLAVLSMVAVRLVGRLQKYSAVITLAEGSPAVFRSHEYAAVVSLVNAVNDAKNLRRPRYAEAWGVGKPVNG